MPSLKYRGILSDAEFTTTQAALENGDLLEVVSVAGGMVRRVSSTQVSIAVTGASGNGMSTFVNALRDIGHEEEASAPTGVVRTTLTRASYSSPYWPNVVLWDLPGMGATPQTLDDYVMGMQFSQYDLFIIIASEQFSRNHVMLAKTIQALGKKFYIVWTKLDIDLSRRRFMEGELLRNIRESLLENLQKEQVCQPPIFLISSYEPLRHDFPKLKDTLQKDLCAIRCQGPLHTLMDIYEKIINEKVANQKEKITTSPFPPQEDADDLMVGLKAYHLVFGVHDDSLLQVAQRMGRELLEYRAIMKSQDLKTLIRENWILRGLTCSWVNTFIWALSYIPLLGSVISHQVRQMKHRYVLALVAEDTKAVLRKVLNDYVIQG